jgi:uncharacterized protein
MAKAEGVVFFQAGGMALALFPRHELAEDANISAEGHGFSGISLAYNTRNREEVDSVLAEAKTAGAELLKPSQEAFWGGYSGLCGRSRGTPLSRWRRTELFVSLTNPRLKAVRST